MSPKRAPRDHQWLSTRKTTVLALLTNAVALLGCAAGIAMAPPLVGLGIALASAAGWTLWLERHP